MHMELLIDKINTIYESINIYFGLVVYDAAYKDYAVDLFKRLSALDYPVCMYNTGRINQNNYRLYFVSDLQLAMFSLYWGPMFKNTNFIVVIGDTLFDNVKLMIKNFQDPEYRVVINASGT